MVMETRKITGLLCAAALAAGFVAGGMGALSANAETAATAVQLTNENTELFLPQSYEQYLSLENPSYMAMSDKHLAVSDGTLLYVYDKETNAYTRYDAATETHNTVITKIQMSSDDRLLFTAGGRLYEYDYDLQTSECHAEVPSSTFLIEGDFLYAVAMDSGYAHLSRYPLNNLKRSAEELINTTTTNIVSKLTFQNGTLYCVRYDNNIIRYDLETKDQLTIGVLDTHGQVSDLKFVCAYGDYLYYTVNGENPNYKNGLYRTDFSYGDPELLIEADGFSAIRSYDGELYCICNASLLKLTVTDEGVRYSDYEIASSSPSVNRLGSACDSVRAGDLLVTADQANNRVTVYNLSTNEYSVVPCKGENGVFTPNAVATDGEIIAVSSENRIYTCKYGDESFTLRTERRNTVTGLACVYDSCYFITLNSFYGKLDGTNETVRESYGSPSALTSDVYGNLYVACADGTVRKYTEEEFTDPNASGTVTGALPTGFTSLRADFDGNLYCLAENQIYRNGQIFAEVDASECIFRDTVPAPVSLALGFEDKRVYLVYDNFVLKTTALDFPTLDCIATEGTEADLFNAQTALNLVTVQENAVGFLTDLDALKAGSGGVFPYGGYFRNAQSERGILLAETNDYNLVAQFGADHKYTARLFKKNYCTPVDRDSYWRETTGQDIRYLTSDVSLSYFPCLVPALRSVRLTRGAQVTLLGIISAEDQEGVKLFSDYDYAYISCETEDGNTEYGYLPLSYLTRVRPNLDSESYRLAYLKASEEGVEFVADSGARITVTERTQVEVIEQDGQLIARITQDGVRYYATVTEDRLARPAGEALRISLIVVLSVAAALIIGGYVFLLPRKKEKK